MLRIFRLSKTYANGVRALDGVDLEVPPGLFGLLGPNGAGKSTLMRTLAALQEPDAGEVALDGVDVLADPHWLRRRLGYLPQDFGVYPSISALELLDHLAVLEGIVGRRARREQVEELLRRTNLFEARKKAVSTFSGGMKRRFGIAQALLGDPRLIIVDEPTAGLDPEERDRFHDLLSEIGESAVVLLSTHIVADVSDLCPRMAVLAGGRVILEGEPETLVRRLEGRLWSKFVPKGRLDAYRAALPVISTRLHAGKTQVHVVCDTAPEAGFEPVRPTLSDVYFAALARPSAVLREGAAC